MLGVVERFIDAHGNVADTQGVAQAAMAERDREGMSQDRFQQIMQHFQNLGDERALGDRICTVLAHPST